MSHRARRLPAALAALIVLVAAACSSSADGGAASSSAPTVTAAPPVTTTSVPPTSTTPTAPTPSTAPSKTPSPAAAPRATPRPSPRSSSPTVRTGRLPLDLNTGDATQVITVVSDRASDTRATLQRWRKSGSGWRTVGRSVAAYVGSSGIGRARESSSRTPAGSFTLTQAFGRDANPGTRLPYLRTTSDDYWISSPGAKYNTEQRCGGCGYDNGVNERLHDVTPEYDHAVVIDYNTRNAPGGVQPGRGSAFFLHIAAGEPTAGCVAIPRGDLVTVMTWLRPSDGPRILIGTD